MGKRLIKGVPISSLPRERMKIYGVETLSDQELLAILLRTGQHPYSVMSIAGNLLKAFGGLVSLRQAALHELEEIRGIGRMGAVGIKALIELGRRIQMGHERVAPPVHTSCELVQQLILEMKDHKQEHLVYIYLDAENQVILKKTVFIDSLNRSVARPREIFRCTTRYCATRIVLAHNHPSGNVILSQQDMNFTKRIQKCEEMMGITVLNYSIIGCKQYFSLREEGMMEKK